MNSLSASWKTVFGIILAIILLPVILYLINFGSGKLSPEFQDWVSFSTYWSPFLVTALTVILAYISWQSLEITKLKEKPILALSFEPLDPKYPDASLIYSLRNLGQGPALNIKLFIKIEYPPIGSDPFLMRKGLINKHLLPDRPTDYEYMVHSISLVQNEILRLDWHQRICNLIVSYTDIYGSSFSIKANGSQIEYLAGDIMGVDNQGKKNGEIWFTDGTQEDPYLGQKRVFVLGEVLPKIWDLDRV